MFYIGFSNLFVIFFISVGNVLRVGFEFYLGYDFLELSLINNGE